MVDGSGRWREEPLSVGLAAVRVGPGEHADRLPAAQQLDPDRTYLPAAKIPSMPVSTPNT